MLSVLMDFLNFFFPGSSFETWLGSVVSGLQNADWSWLEVASVWLFAIALPLLWVASLYYLLLAGSKLAAKRSGKTALTERLGKYWLAGVAVLCVGVIAASGSYIADYAYNPPVSAASSQ